VASIDSNFPPDTGLSTTGVVQPKQPQKPATRRDWMRRLNLVRKQEFAYLRSIQKREGGESSEQTLAGFPIRMSSVVAGRGDTVKKIDDIEAQLELMWSLSRGRPTESPLDADSESELRTPQSGLKSADATVHSAVPDAALLVSAVNLASAALVPPTLLDERSVNSTAAASPKTLTQKDVALSKAAMFFANADYACATEILLNALRDAPRHSLESLRQALAVLDVYRITDQQALFDATVLRYFDYWNGSTPQWHSPSAVHTPSDRGGMLPSEETARFVAAPRGDASVWRCPERLNPLAARELIAHWRSGEHCGIDWEFLTAIEPEAAAMLAKQFKDPKGAPSHLVYWGAARWLNVLKESTPQGNANVPRSLWDLRFGVLALMGFESEYDAAAADFCLTYIEQAPPWPSIRVQFQGDFSATTAEEVGQAGTPLQLKGHVLGEQGLGLPALLGSGPLPPITIDCKSLLRIDPKASTQLLDWLRTAKSKKADVHLCNVSVLVGAAWSAAGVGEYAQIQLLELT